MKLKLKNLFLLKFLFCSMIIYGTNPFLVTNTDWEGTWETTFGELRLHQPQSTVVYGDYGDVGVIEASYSNSGVLSGTFTNGNRMGQFQFQINGNRFSGQWNWTGENPSNNKWTGTKKSSLRPKLNQYHFIWQGTWQTQFGELRLRQKDDFVFGDYANKGIMKGYYNPIDKTLSGTFNNNSKAGTFVFTLKGNEFKGTWNWKTQTPSSANTWQGTKKNINKPVFKEYSNNWNFSTNETCKDVIVKRILSAKEFSTFYSNYRWRGYKLMSLNGYDSKGKKRLAAVWEKREKNRQIPVYELTSNGFQKAFNTYTKNGYRLTYVDGYKVNGNVYFTGIFEKGNGPSYYAHHILSESGFLKFHQDYKNKGYRIAHLTAYQFEGQPHYGAIWEKKSGGDMIVKHKIPYSQFQNEFEKNSKTHRLQLIEGYYINNEIYYAAVWEKKSGLAWTSAHDTNGFGYIFSDLENQSEGRKVSQLCVYSNGTNTHYGAIWTDKGNTESRRLRSEINKCFDNEQFGNSISRGFLVKEVDGPTLAETGACLLFQPLSTLKLLPYLYTITEIDQKKETMKTNISWRETTVDNPATPFDERLYGNCILPNDPNSQINSAPISAALPTMMWESHNRTVEAFLDRYTIDNINGRMKQFGLTNTISHYGCPHPGLSNWTKNKSTLFDLAKLFEGVHCMEFINRTASRKLFFENMILLNFDGASYSSPITGSTVGPIRNSHYRRIVQEEAGSGKQHLVDEFMRHLELRGKGGSGGPSSNEFGYSDFLYVTLPFKENGQIHFKSFLTGWYLYGLKTPPGCPENRVDWSGSHCGPIWQNEYNDIDHFKQEILRIPIRQALASW